MYRKYTINIVESLFIFAKNDKREKESSINKSTRAMRLQNKTALVTGAASGNGKAIATLFAQEGAKVILADINKEGVLQVAKDLQQQGYETLAVNVDVTNEADIEKMVSTAISAFGHLNILINNTGIFDMLVPVADTDDALWEKVLAINLTAPMRAIRYAIPIFKKQGGGVIVNTASIAGLTGARGGGAAYVASKHGLVGLTKHVAFCYKEWNIRCNAVAPGRVDTNIRDNSKKSLQVSDQNDSRSDDMTKIIEKVSVGYALNQRKASPGEIANAVLFLASDEASFINGSILVADGAWTTY